MRWDIPTATAVWKKGKDTSDEYLEKNAQLRTRSLLSLGNQSQLDRNPAASSRPATMKANRQPPKSANPRARGNADRRSQYADGQERTNRLRPSLGGNDIGQHSHRCGREHPCRQTGQHPERQEHFDIGREGRGDNGHHQHQESAKYHRTASKRIGQGPCCN